MTVNLQFVVPHCSRYLAGTPVGCSAFSLHRRRVFVGVSEIFILLTVVSWSGGVAWRGVGEERSDGGARCCMLPVVFATPSISLSVCVCALACAADAIAFQSPHDFLVPALTPLPFLLTSFPPSGHSAPSAGYTGGCGIYCACI